MCRRNERRRRRSRSLARGREEKNFGEKWHLVMREIECRERRGGRGEEERGGCGPAVGPHPQKWVSSVAHVTNKVMPCY
jgi:hypothetical protein